MPDPALHRIAIDSEWTLVDLYEFPHAYTQVYAFLYSLAQNGRFSAEFIDEIYRRHPWRGGYSAFNFYSDLYYAMEEEHRPMVHSIRYSSPGFIEIAALLAMMTQIQNIVKAVAKSVEIVDATYDRIYKRAQKRKLLALDVRKREQELKRDEIDFLIASSEELAKMIHFDGLELLQSRTKDSLGTLKILFSFYRRVRQLVAFQLARKIKYEGDDRQIDDKK